MFGSQSVVQFGVPNTKNKEKRQTSLSLSPWKLLLFFLSASVNLVFPESHVTRRIRYVTLFHWLLSLSNIIESSSVSSHGLTALF